MKRTFWQEDQAVLRKEKVQQKVQQNFKSGSGGLPLKKHVPDGFKWKA